MVHREGAEHDPPGLRLAECWAGFTKIASIFPESSPRVREGLDVLFGELESALANREGARRALCSVCFHRNEVDVDGVLRNLAPGTNLHWLKARIEKAALAGVSFLADVTRGAILGFTGRLLHIWGGRHRAPRFEDLWPEKYPGLELIDRRFAGRFEGVTKSDAPVRTWGRRVDTPPGTDLTSADAAITRTLMEDPRIQSALADLRTAAVLATSEAEPTRNLDAIGQIVRQMPRDLGHDREAAIRVALVAIQRLSTRLVQPEAGGPLDAGPVQTMVEVGQVLLGRRDELPPPAEACAPAPPLVSPASSLDALITDDPQGFLRDLAALPPPHPLALSEQKMESPSEQTGVFLHFLVKPAEEALEPHVRRHLDRLLASAGPEEWAVLRQYLSLRERNPAGDGKGHFDRLVRYLRDANAHGTLRLHRILPAESVIDSFPHNFGLFVGCINPRVPEESAKLTLLVKSLGPDRIFGARAQLIAEEGAVDPPVAERLAELDTPSVLPFLRLILEEGSEPMRRKAVEALRRIRGDEPAACLLRLGFDDGDLPQSYLLALTDERPGSDCPWTFRTLVVSQICRLVRVLADRKERIASRLEAIELLGMFYEVEAREQLETLVHARRLGVLPRESQTVRETARRALRSNARIRLET